MGHLRASWSGPVQPCFKGPIEVLIYEKPALTASPRQVRLPMTGRDAAARGTSGVPGCEITREFAGLAKYLTLAGEGGQRAVCG